MSLQVLHASDQPIGQPRVSDPMHGFIGIDRIEGFPDVSRALLVLQNIRSMFAALGSFEATVLAAVASAVDASAVAGRDGEPEPGSRELILRTVSAELGAATRVSDQSMAYRIDESFVLLRDYPALHRAWSDGVVDQRVVRMITDEGKRISDPEARVAFTEAAIERSRTCSAGRVRAAVRHLAERFVAESITVRHRRAARERGVSVQDLDDGMSRLCAEMPTIQAHGIYDRVSRMAWMQHQIDREQRAEAQGQTGQALVGEQLRGIDEIRADILAEMLLTLTPVRIGERVRAERVTDERVSEGGSPERVRAERQRAERVSGIGIAAPVLAGRVQVVIPVDVLTGVSDAGAFVPGVGPVSAEEARTVASTAAGWDRMFADPVTGAPVGVDRYRPSRQQRRFLAARDEHCRFPGCRVAIRRCDVDHTIDHQYGGRTTVGNLANLCRRHHTLKHQTPWTVTQEPGGVLRWRSPGGDEYVDHPPATLRTVSPSELARSGGHRRAGTGSRDKRDLDLDVDAGPGDALDSGAARAVRGGGGGDPQGGREAPVRFVPVGQDDRPPFKRSACSAGARRSDSHAWFRPSGQETGRAVIGRRIDAYRGVRMHRELVMPAASALPMAAGALRLPSG